MNGATDISRFRFLHDIARRLSLGPADAQEYTQRREAIAAALCRVQGTPVPDGISARPYFRVATHFRIELAWDGKVEKTKTVSVSLHDFAAVVTAPPPSGVEATCRFHLAHKEAVDASVVVESISSYPPSGPRRATFRFATLSEAAMSRIESALFDVLLRNLPR